MASPSQAKLQRQLTVSECDALLTAPGAPFETHTIQVDGRNQRVYKNMPPHFRALIEPKMKLHGEKVMLSSPMAEPSAAHARENITFNQMLEQSYVVAAWLREQGCRVGSRVGIAGSNQAGWVRSYVAVNLIGAVPVYVNSSLQSDAIVHCLAITNPIVTLADLETTERLSELAPELTTKNVGPIYCWSSVSDSRYPGVRDITGINPPGATIRAVKNGEGLEGLSPTSDGTIFFTSGTTGYPKAVLSTQSASLHYVHSGSFAPSRAYLRAGLGMESIGRPPARQPCALLPVPLFHATGCLAWLTRSFTAGMKFVFMRRWSVPHAIRLIAEEDVNIIGGVPSIVIAILQSPLLPPEKKFDSISYGGAPPPERLAQDLRKRWPAAMVQHGWGMTETNGLHCGLAGQDYVDRGGSVGPPLPISEIKVCHPETGEELLPGELGVVFARGANIMKEYVNDPAATAKTLSRDGWLDTGDMGYVDELGFLFLRDRAKDLIIRGGENIASAEVENAIALDDRIAEVAAVAVPDPVLGEKVAVHVSLAPGSGATPNDIMLAARSRLRYAAQPVLVVVSADPLPRNANGKIIKAECKTIVRAIWEEQEGAAKARRAKL